MESSFEVAEKKPQMYLTVFLFIVSLTLVASKPIHGSVFYRNGKYQFQDGIDKSASAWGSFDDKIEETGWGYLDLETNPDHSNEIQGYAAGFLEGCLTTQRIYQMHVNLNYFYDKQMHRMKPKPALLDFIKDQQSFIQSNAYSPTADDYWKVVSAIDSQLLGLHAGYNSRAQNQLNLYDFQMMSGCGDFLDLVEKFSTTYEGKTSEWWSKQSRDYVSKYRYQQGHCSSIVKVVPDNIFMGHTAWFTYGNMLRIFKNYRLNLHHAKSPLISFSSYPGYLSSLDDFYMAESGVWVTETTNSIFNHSLYDASLPHSVPAWMRQRIALHVSDNAIDWAKVYSKHNSGTYNNQYIIVDSKKFVNGQMEPDTIVVLEQIPGKIIFEDQTDFVRKQTYWPSYNVPFYKEIFDISGYPAMAKSNPDFFDYEHCARANIFRRDHHNVVDIKSYQHIIRYNDFKNDPLSKGNPGLAIASRFDLAPQGERMPFGAYDGKCTSARDMKDMRAFIISGPTEQQPVFEWTKEFSNTSHIGQPVQFNFDWHQVEPKHFN